MPWFDDTGHKKKFEKDRQRVMEYYRQKEEERKRKENEERRKRCY